MAGEAVGTQPLLTRLQSPRYFAMERVYCQMLEAHRGSDLQWMRGALAVPLTLCCQPGPWSLLATERGDVQWGAWRCPVGAVAASPSPLG